LRFALAPTQKLRHIFAPRIATQCSLAAQNRRKTAGTLCEMGAKIFVNLLKKDLTKMKKRR
jgi:hypothetical protein